MKYEYLMETNPATFFAALLFWLFLIPSDTNDSNVTTTFTTTKITPTNTAKPDLILPNVTTTLSPTNITKPDYKDGSSNKIMYISIGIASGVFLLFLILFCACCVNRRKTDTLHRNLNREVSHNYDYPEVKKTATISDHGDYEDCSEDCTDTRGYSKSNVEHGNDKKYESLTRFCSTGKLVTEGSDTDSVDYETPNVDKQSDIELYGNLSVKEYENVGRSIEEEDMYEVPNSNPTEIGAEDEYIEFTG